MYREQGRGMPGVLSKVGLGTFMDPRVDGGCLNPSAKRITEELKAQDKEFIKYIPDFLGEEYLFYRGLPYTKGLIRATTADENGNITAENEVYNLELSAVARAVKAYGGTVIVQVERLAKAGSLDPKLVKVSRNLVDYVVVAENPEDIVHGLWPHGVKKYTYWQGFTGRIRVPIKEALKPMPLDPQKVIVRRALMEAQPGWMCNFGIGLPTFCGNVLAEEGVYDEITLISESGSIGGVPGSGPDFGCHWNVEASVDQGEHFDWFDGTGIDFGVFGLSEAQEDGSINTSYLNGVTLGVGGFANIAANAKVALFIGTFTTKGLEETIEDGKLVIKKEGKIKKFVKKCLQLTFDANLAVKRGKKLLYITERCVLERTPEGMVLTEIAPGVDLQKDILDQMEFTPIIPPGGPKLMPAEIFQPVWGNGGLKAVWDAKVK
ncbi:acylCoA:acetate/3-ketoacidCoAtransferase [Pelotomaculum thermopropionicum SI]|uniref:AcylCoA:acetate/3-ketoacidCoAtransferase n=1 Tax=Pelotomaculum thermopropionicum (strain DSM 13744 / JCM 10971 / SI) TaxID=370438 RepID=A5D1Z1_PELTS|nr:acylCoA:acetate/3-ketoacidCoAtransferase [Pelotomaculum thermopropionicum SI]